MSIQKVIQDWGARLRYIKNITFQKPESKLHKDSFERFEMSLLYYTSNVFSMFFTAYVFLNMLSGASRF